VIAFDSVEKAMAWQNSPVTKEISAARMKSTDSSSFLVEGVAESEDQEPCVAGH
jgi:uncharacterized protein (DUF1330 family)